jgi:hypothetical protein
MVIGLLLAPDWMSLMQQSLPCALIFLFRQTRTLELNRQRATLEFQEYLKKVRKRKRAKKSSSPPEGDTNSISSLPSEGVYARCLLMVNSALWYVDFRSEGASYQLVRVITV